MFSNAFKLGTVSGFDIKVDPSWILIAALVTWTLSQQYFPAILPDQSLQWYVVMAVIAMLSFFASLLLHELAHSVVARSLSIANFGQCLCDQDRGTTHDPESGCRIT